jgi:hypothetical protein
MCNVTQLKHVAPKGAKLKDERLSYKHFCSSGAKNSLNLL